MKKRRKYFVCIQNEGYAVSLDVRKIYVGLPDSAAELLGMIRVIDESGEDYLYPRNLFAPISLPTVIRQELKMAA
jgi:hypothetical protein